MINLNCLANTKEKSVTKSCTSLLTRNLGKRLKEKFCENYKKIIKASETKIFFIQYTGQDPVSEGVLRFSGFHHLQINVM